MSGEARIAAALGTVLDYCILGGSNKTYHETAQAMFKADPSLIADLALAAAVRRLMFHDEGDISWGTGVVSVWADTDGHFFDGLGPSLTVAIEEALATAQPAVTVSDDDRSDR